MNHCDQPNPLAQPNPENQPKLQKHYINPSIEVETFEKPSYIRYIKLGIFQILPDFYGNIDKDPYDHLPEFSKICATIKDDYSSIKLTLLPFSLKGEARYWFSNLEVTTWTKLFNDFITRFYPHGKTNIKRKLNANDQLY